MRRFESRRCLGVFHFSSMGPGKVREMSVGLTHMSSKGDGGRVVRFRGSIRERRFLGIHWKGATPEKFDLTYGPGKSPGLERTAGEPGRRVVLTTSKKEDVM